MAEADMSSPHKAPAPPPNSLPGIDVSHHQDTIDWAQVAGSGIRFAIAKATEGTGYIDPLFSTNRADAMAAGIAFGAYHFARPDRGRATLDGLDPREPAARRAVGAVLQEIGFPQTLRVRELVGSGVAFRELEVVPVSLEDAFVTLTRDSDRAGGGSGHG